MMDWYNGLDTEDFVVPKDEELLDVFPSQESWQQWGMSGSHSFGWPMRFEPLKRSDLPDEKNHQKAPIGKANGQLSLYESENPNEFNISGGWHKDPWCGNGMTYDRPDFQFNELMKNDHMDDIFLSSLLEEDLSATENNEEKSSNHCTTETSQLSSVPADGSSGSLLIDLQSVSGVVQSAESSQDLKTGHVATSNVSNCTSVSLDDRYVPQVLHPSYERSSNQQSDSSGNCCIGGEVSLEESVLNDFGVTLTQLSKNTRLCFRNSLYRLAQNSTKQTLLSGQVKDPASDEHSEMDVDEERIRSGETATAESETNTIDRAVANFVFKKMDANTQDLLPSMSGTKRKCEAIDETKGTKYISFSRPEIYEYSPA